MLDFFASVEDCTYLCWIKCNFCSAFNLFIALQPVFQFSAQLGAMQHLKDQLEQRTRMIEANIHRQQEELRKIQEQLQIVHGQGLQVSSSITYRFHLENSSIWNVSWTPNCTTWSSIFPVSCHLGLICLKSIVSEAAVPAAVLLWNVSENAPVLSRPSLAYNLT